MSVNLRLLLVFISGTLILFKQLQFLNDQNLGISLDQRIAISGPRVKGENYEQRRQAFRDKLSTLPFVQNFSGTGYWIGKGYNFSQSGITRLNPNPGEEKVQYRMYMIDENFAPTYEIELVAGRSFLTSEALKGWEVNKVILNESATRTLGFDSPEAAVGQLIKWSDRTDEVVGVISDYNHRSLHIPVEPIVFLPSRNSGVYTLQINPANLSDKLTQLESIYQELFPGNPFEYEFLDETFAQFYQGEQELGRIFTAASLLAIFISGLGLFGLATFIARQKMKEIGIRKVLGASISSILTMLSKDFLKANYSSPNFGYPRNLVSDAAMVGKFCLSH